jgi:hypothetical protein
MNVEKNKPSYQNLKRQPPFIEHEKRTVFPAGKTAATEDR